ncbi:CRAL-TRIO domain-containing protein [Aspergillus pseudotamarii]|uniref:CRAL-TRIO domain-containing protein n=1 Tax=Aspergillus pseudotamarii TaxID=132259 RepID=A0A5N6T6L2_ASPPS|nr:CRAL-TRIO domain-containing protein [Aspergillus pseudotamarii]KAE8141841.1 CRAL-TRIO domain-containing protein [Aspergillus pseudotamarii]
MGSGTVSAPGHVPIDPNPSAASAPGEVNLDDSTRQVPSPLASGVISPALDLLKSLLKQQGYEVSNPAACTDDTTLLRFLRAQRFNPEQALQQFHSAQKWRQENNIPSFYQDMDIDYYEETRKMYPQWIGRRDNDGHAIYIFPVRHLTKKMLGAYLKKISSCPSSKAHRPSNLLPEDLHFHALYENLLQFVFPLVSDLPRPDMSTPISASTHIVDVSGVSIRQFWSIRKYLQQASATATIHYPETLAKVFVIGAPAFFKSIWDVISQWFDPVTRSKIFLLSSSEANAVLRQYIDPANLPVKYGGILKWEWQDLPNLDVHARRLVDNLYEKTDQGEIFAKGPVIFENGCIKLLGTINGKPRRNNYCPR